MMGYSHIWKPLLFRLDPEVAHHVSVNLLRLASRFSPIRSWWNQRSAPAWDPALVVEKAGLRFPNPVGLAAGFDKNALLVDALPLLGFGFAEIGTVTPRPQKGNPRPRLFRIPEEDAILNRMGFNNDGVLDVAHRLARRRPHPMILGGNIGKNKDTPNEKAHEDYKQCFQVLQDLVDYFTVNVSSPNTPGLRQLLEREALSVLLESVMNENQKRSRPTPVFLKISPDLSSESIESVVGACKEFGLAGLVATNTTLDRQVMQDSRRADRFGPGGLSGRPLSKKALDVISQVKSKSENLVLMASGGIMGVPEARECLEAGADLVQLYSGLVYQGPGLPLEMLRNLNLQH